MSDKKKIVLVTSGQPSLNPRLVKEADTLAAKGYEVLVIYAYWNSWGTAIDKQLLPSKKWKAIRVGGHPEEEPAIYFLSRLLFKAAAIAARKTGLKLFADIAIARASFFLKAGALKHKADLYIGHNLGALPAVIGAAKKYNKPCGFDAEDLHRFEMSNDPTDNDVALKSHIEYKYFPQADYLTASSPQITSAYKKIFPDLAISTLINTFSKKYAVTEAKPPGSTIKIFWFSQTIGSNRGLEDIIGALKILGNTSFELHLLGNLLLGFEDIYLKNLLAGNSTPVILHQPVPPDELPQFASQFDVGLALEPAFSINNDLALSNKLFTYLQAGLAIVASNTSAQQTFMDEHKTIGKLYKKGDIAALAAILENYHKNKDELWRAKKSSLALACSTINWETESVKFLKLVKQTLQAD